jgi:tRNA-modifying protein YgfZ
MPETYCSELEDRGVIRITGDDARDFLQGLISNDINNVKPDRTIYAALLTPQGKYLFDFFITEHNDALLFETQQTRIPDLIKRLNLYKLRAKAELEDVSEDWRVAAIWGEGAAETLSLPSDAGSTGSCGQGIAFVDPRLAAAGLRVLLPRGDALPEITESTAKAYDSHRLALGLPDGSRDLVLEKSILLESGFDELHGVDWNKGCYMGQELTARTKYRGLIKKRLVPISIDGPLPEPGTLVTAGDKTVGEVRSGRDKRALALIRLEALENGSTPLHAGDATVTPEKPDWAVF